MTLRCKIVSGNGFRKLATLPKGEPEVYVIYDKNVAWVALETVRALQEAGIPLRGQIGIDTSEELKTMETVLSLERQLLAAGASRKALLIAVGGGITTDLVGFTAAIYKRGIRYANVPTTLLAQVDAAIGGKTGVNLDGYKNMLGAFCLPQFTYLCADVLNTLPPEIFRSGLAELLKTFLLADADAYHKALGGVTPDLLRKAARIKAGIVQRDPYEKGERAILNLGHTFGHAIEHEAQQRGDSVSHGAAVSMGIILAARLSDALFHPKAPLSPRLTQDFQAAGLPTESPYPLETLAAAMEKDKKAAGGKVRFVLLEAVGRPVLKEMAVQEALELLK